MAFERIVTRQLPDGKIGKVYPFHISLEGMESVLLCRDDEDYDQLEKSFYLSDWNYLESAFNHDQTFFLKTIGSVNMAEMEQRLLLNSRVKHSDSEMLAIVVDMADKFYHKSVPELTPDMKARMLPYLYRGYRTTIPQLARCLQLPREIVASLVTMHRRKTVP